MDAKDGSKWLRLKRYDFVVLLIVILFGLLAFLVPYTVSSGLKTARALVASFLFGSLVGFAEIASRYRDEPLRAVGSPYGLAYLVINGYLSLLAFLLIMYLPAFSKLARDPVAGALVAGFGAMVVMRSRIAVIKTADGKDESIGPDYVLRIILRTIDLKIDRWRAESRQEILARNLEYLEGLGDFESTYRYLGASLLAFQNLDEDQKRMLHATFTDYKDQKLPDRIKVLGLGFIFLTLVGEAHFSQVVKNARDLKTKASLSIGQSVNLPIATPAPPPGLP